MIITFFENSNLENYFITDDIKIEKFTLDDEQKIYTAVGLYVSSRDISTEIRRIIKRNEQIIGGTEIYCDEYTRKRIFNIIENYKGELEDDIYEYLFTLREK